MPRCRCRRMRSGCRGHLPRYREVVSALRVTPADDRLAAGGWHSRWLAPEVPATPGSMIFAAVSTAFPRPIVTSSSKSAVRAGRVLSGIAVAFLTLDAAMKLLHVGGSRRDRTTPLSHVVADHDRPHPGRVPRGVPPAAHRDPRRGPVDRVPGRPLPPMCASATRSSRTSSFRFTSRRCCGAASGCAIGVFAACSRRSTTEDMRRWLDAPSPLEVTWIQPPSPPALRRCSRHT